MSQLPHPPARNYRTDIDGLRGIAVLMVLGEHLDVHRMSGGYIGVDIFFVISGYLITGIITKEVANGKFRLSKFYQRRAKRILPALFTVLIATSMAVCFLFPPRQTISYGYSLLTALFSSSNFYFATTSGYFSDAYTKILQHTWSLAVEEQFYLFFPLVLMLAAKWSKRKLGSLIGIAWGLSFLWACTQVRYNATFAFFMPFTRAWELLSGSALALGLFPAISRRWLRESLAWISLLVLLACMAHYTNATLFPGVSAFPIILASMILLNPGSSDGFVAKRLLGSKPLVFLGLLSYSLYLWHWPVLILLRLGLFLPVGVHGPLQQLAVAVVCLAIAYASLRLVEQPFRTGRFRGLTEESTFIWTAGVCAVFTCFALVLIFTHGWKDRFSPQAAQVGQYLDLPQQMNSGVCFEEEAQHPLNASTCLAAVPDRKNILLLGDSHAAMFWYALKRTLPADNIMQFSGSGCYPKYGSYDRSRCGSLRRYLFEKYLPNAHPDAVILSARWSSIADFEEMWPLLRILQNKAVPTYVIGPVPEFKAPLPLLLALGLKWSEPDLAQARERPAFRSLDQDVSSQLRGQQNIHYLSAYLNICGQSDCRLYADDQKTIPMLIDDNHLSNEGALRLVQHWVETKQLP